MSLFKARDWWSTTCGENEEFDRGCLCVGNIDNEPNNASGDKIAVGSFAGKLRIFHPRSSRFSPMDLMLELRLEAPILQIELGKFVPQSQSLALGVLMTRKFVVFTVESPRQAASGAFSGEFGSGSGGVTDSSPTGGAATAEDKPAQLLRYTITKRYEHSLDRIAVNFCFGPFGGVYGKDNICVRSFDGRLSFFERDHFVFSRFLSSKYVIPGPVCYSKAMDCFLTFNTCLELECFKYRVLAASTGSAAKEAAESRRRHAGTGGKKIQADWSIVLGEEIYDITTARYSQYASGRTEIVVLGERTLFVLKENGRLVSRKRLDYYPSCIHAYNAQANALAKRNLIVGSHNAALYIYKDPRLIWSAKLHSIPVSIRVGTFGGTRGMIVTLDDRGEVCVNYLGTDPSFSNIASRLAGSAEKQEFDFARLEDEHKKLKALIRRALKAGKREPGRREGLALAIGTPRLGVRGNDRKYASYKLLVSYGEKDTHLENVNISIVLPPPFAVLNDRSLFSFETIRGGPGTPLRVPFSVVVASDRNAGRILPPQTLRARIIATYICVKNNGSGFSAGSSSSGAARDDYGSVRRRRRRRTATLDFDLPLALAGHIVRSKKIDTYKITLEANRPAPTIFDLFPDVIYSDTESARGVTGGGTSDYIKVDNRSFVTGGNVMTFKYANRQDVTVLISRNTSRYRVQGADFDALWLLTRELCRRLEAHHAKADARMPGEAKEPFRLVTIEKELPYRPLFDLVDRHFGLRCELRAGHNRLRDLAHRFRSIRKRLLIRYKDRNPAPLNNMNILFERTCSVLAERSKFIEEKRRELVEASARLANAVRLFVWLAKIDLRMTTSRYELLCRFISPATLSNDASTGGDSAASAEDQGWEEVTDASLTHLLRTALAKNSKERESVPRPIGGLQKDTKKLKKHLAIVMDRLAKGGLALLEASLREAKPDDAAAGANSGKHKKSAPAAANSASGKQRPA